MQTHRIPGCLLPFASSALPLPLLLCLGAAPATAAGPRGTSGNGLLAIAAALVAATVLIALFHRKVRQADRFRRPASSTIDADALWEAAVDAMRLTDNNGIILKVNAAYCQLVGRPREELEGTPFTSVYAPAERERAIAAHREYVQAGSSSRLVEQRFVLWNGREVWLDASASVMPSASGPRILSVQQEVTARRLTADLLQKERQRLAAILEGTGVGTWEWTLPTGETVCNERWAGMLGYTLEELEPHTVDNWKRLTHPADLAVAETLLAQHFAGVLPRYDWEGRMRHKDGSWIWVQCRGKVSAWSPDGSPLRMSGTNTDITARKRIEEELRASRDEARRLALVAERTTNSVILTGVDGGIVWTNAAFERLTGWSGAEAAGKPLGSLYRDGRSDPEADAALRDAIGTIRGVRVPLLLCDRQNQERWLDTDLQPVFDEGGSLSGFIAVQTDITAQVEMRERLASMLHSMAAGVMVLNNQGGIIECNPEAERLLGRSREQLLDTSTVDPLWGAIYPDGSPWPTEDYPVMRTLRTGQGIRNAVMGIRLPDGGRRWIGINTQILRGGTGEQKGAIASFTDHTDLRRMEQALRESEARYRTLSDAMPVMVWMARPDGSMADANQAYLDFTGTTLDRLQGHGWLDFVHPGDRDMCREACRRSASPGKTVDIEFRFRRRDGEYRWLLDRGKPRFSESGEVLDFIGGCIDITERKEAEAKLQQANQRVRHLATALQQAPVSVVLCDRDGNIQFVNHTFTQTTGYEAAEVIGQNPRLLKSGRTPPDVFEDMWAALAGGNTWRGELLNRKKNGELFWELAVLAPLLDDDGSITGYVGVKEDITLRKRAEEELQRATALSQDLAQHAQAASLAKSEFLANMSHELRTPMNGVIGMIGLLLESGLTREQREHAEVIRSSGESLLTILNDILDLSKIEAGKLGIEHIGFDLIELLAQVHDLLGVQARRKGLELLCEAAADIPRHLQGDPTRLRQILLNLAGNALKFTHQGSVQVVVSALDRDGASVLLRFAIRDTGIGIPAHKLDTLFEKFSQVDGSTTRQYGGTGLGLVISRQLARMMGGDIGVSSEEGRGSEFSLTLRLPVAADSQEGSPARLDGVRVLVADPEPGSRNTTTSLLESWGALVTEVHDAPSAFRALEATIRTGRTFELLVLDHRIAEDAADGDGDLLVILPSEQSRPRTRLARPVRPYDLQQAIQRVSAPVERGGSQEPAAPALPEARILLVEDNAVNQHVATRLLSRLGLRPDVVSNGREAVQALGGSPYDLVLMDLHMPVMDGLEATRIIRSPDSAVSNHGVPILAMTASAMDQDRQRCLDAGMDDFVAKPVSLDQLERALRRWLVPSPDGARQR